MVTYICIGCPFHPPSAPLSSFLSSCFLWLNLTLGIPQFPYLHLVHSCLLFPSLVWISSYSLKIFCKKPIATISCIETNGDDTRLFTRVTKHTYTRMTCTVLIFWSLFNFLARCSLLTYSMCSQYIKSPPPFHRWSETILHFPHYNLRCDCTP